MDISLGCHLKSLLLHQFQNKKGLHRHHFFLPLSKLDESFNESKITLSITVQEPIVLHKELKYRHLQALKNGDKKSFRWVYDQYHQLIYYYCLKLLRQNTLAEEATADVFVTLWQKRQIVKPEGAFTPLLYKIAKDIAYNYLKKTAADNRLKLAFLRSVPSRHSQDGEAILIGTEAVEAIHSIVESLPAKRKEIFKLRYYEGMNNQAIARHLDISVNTVREQLARARRFLKEHHDLQENSLLLLLLFIYW